MARAFGKKNLRLFLILWLVAILTPCKLARILVYAEHALNLFGLTALSCISLTNTVLTNVVFGTF